jgi:hypothetical protein
MSSDFDADPAKEKLQTADFLSRIEAVITFIPVQQTVGVFFLFCLSMKRWRSNIGRVTRAM